jgi:hypothetical protein
MIDRQKQTICALALILSLVMPQAMAATCATGKFLPLTSIANVLYHNNFEPLPNRGILIHFRQLEQS